MSTDIEEMVYCGEIRVCPACDAPVDKSRLDFAGEVVNIEPCHHSIDAKLAKEYTELRAEIGRMEGRDSSKGDRIAVAVRKAALKNLKERIRK